MESHDMDSALEEVGGFSKHQLKWILIQMFCVSMGSFAVYPMGFYELQPTYKCLNEDAEWYECQSETFCQDPSIIFEIDHDSDSSLYNWVQQFDLQCAPKKKFGLFGSIFFAGVVIGSLILPRLSDIVGRKKLAILGNLVHLAAVFITLISHSLSLSLMMIFLMGIAMGGRVFVGYIFMSENMMTKDISKATSFMFGLDSLVICFAALYFRFISKDWRTLFIFPIILQGIATLTMMRQHESPKYYYAIGEYEKAREVLTSIGMTNGVLNQSYSKKFGVEFKHDQEVKEEQSIKVFLKHEQNF